jgi:O-antigen ligase
MQHTPRETLSATARPALLDDPGRWAWLGRVALALALAVVISRCLTSEFLRDPVDPSPGAISPPRGAGAATGVVVDLLSCVPALLVLLQQALERRRPRTGVATVLLLAFGAWAALSTAWAGDKFAAAVGAAHLVAAGVLLWTFAQLVRNWAALRAVGAACAGLLLCYMAYGVYYQTVEVPELAQQWRNDTDGLRTRQLHERGWEPDSFAAKQFEAKLLRGEMMGFSTSPNTYAATLVLLTIVTAGLVIQRAADRDPPATWVVPLVLMLPVAWLIWKTQSKAAYLTPLLAAGILAVWGMLGGRLVLWRAVMYAATLVAFVAIAGLVVAYGVKHGNLHNDSMNFRWRYWVAAADLVAQHPLTGVGWNSFGERYLAVRLPVAAEEVKDPHSMFVRAAVELGAVGLSIFVPWLLTLAWRATRPVMSGSDEDDGIGTKALIAAIVLAIGINCLATVDFSQLGAFVLLEVVRRMLYLGLMVCAVALGVDRADRSRIDPRPAPWLLWSTAVGLGMFLLHNLIDFSLFDPSPGPTMLFAALAGSVIGMRTVDDRPARLAWPALGAGAAAFLATAFGFVLPVALAETSALSGDELVRASRPAQAVAMYAAAAQTVPYNADYAMRQANALVIATADPAQVSAALDAATMGDPHMTGPHLLRARYLRRMTPSDRDTIVNSYEAALRLNPNDVAIRIEYGDYLREIGRNAGAAEEYAKALAYNDQFPPDEPKRLSPQRVGELTDLIARLRGGGGATRPQ